MHKNIKVAGLTICLLLLGGCSTTNSIPYKASTANVINIQNTLQAKGSKVAIGEFVTASGVEDGLMCRLLGPVTVSPKKSLSTYIKESFQEELFLAQVYNPSSSNVISGTIEKISFSSMSPANWEIGLRVSSNLSPGYSVAVKYNYDTSFDAWSACRNVADAFAPAVQELLKNVVNHPKFGDLVK